METETKADLVRQKRGGGSGGKRGRGQSRRPREERSLMRGRDKGEIPGAP